MKAINDNGTIKTFTSIPKSWGNKIGVNYMSDSELQNLGFYDVVVPSTNPSQELGDIYFDSDNSRFTYPVNNKTFSQTLAELKEQKIANLKAIYNNKLRETDWEIVRDQELGQSTQQSTLDARAALRTECANHETSINAKTSKNDVVDYQLPNLI
jgi:hypothetical protein